jgi:hypothetical protein
MNMTRLSSATTRPVGLPEMDPVWTRATGAPPVDLRVPTVFVPGRRGRSAGGWGWLSWATRSIDLHQQEEDHGIRNTWIAAASAVGVGTLNGVQVWYFEGKESQSLLVSYVVVHALVALVLTPLIVSVYLALPDLARRLLRRLREDDVIEVRSEKELDAVAPELGWLNHKRLVLSAAALAGLYLVYELLTDLRDLDFPMGILVIGSLIVQAVLVYLAVVATVHLGIVSRAVGKLLRGLPLHLQPLHPDRCGGLWIVGRMFNLMLNVAALFGGVALCLGFALAALHQAPLMPYRHPELALMALFYLALLPSAFLNLLWLPHKLMEHRRSELLKPVARAFNAAIDAARPSPADDAARLRAKADSLSEIARQLRMLDEASPAWPLRMKRLGSVVVTAVLPVVVPLVSTVLSKLLTG